MHFRSGRSSLACDLVEEARCIAERFVLTLLNLQIIGEDDFEKQISGAVWLNAEGRKKVLGRWQEKTYRYGSSLFKTEDSVGAASVCTKQSSG